VRHCGRRHHEAGRAIQLDDGSVRALMPPTGAMTRILDR
jgi:hypothetical protein